MQRALTSSAHQPSFVSESASPVRYPRSSIREHHLHDYGCRDCRRVFALPRGSRELWNRSAIEGSLAQRLRPSRRFQFLPIAPRCCLRGSSRLATAKVARIMCGRKVTWWQRCRRAYPSEPVILLDRGMFAEIGTSPKRYGREIFFAQSVCTGLWSLQECIDAKRRRLGQSELKVVSLSHLY